MNHPHWLTALIAAAALTQVCAAQEVPVPGVVKSMELTRDVSIDDGSLERLLRINTISGTIQLSDIPSESRGRGTSLRLDFYRAGKQLPVKMVKPGVGGAKNYCHGEFSVRIIDTDYLKLGDAPAGHWQIFSELKIANGPKGVGVVSSGPPITIAKSKFDAQPKPRRVGRFTELPEEPTREIPIFFSASGRVSECTSLSQLLSENATSDIIVGVIELR